ncbi:MAG: hypothetical protein Q7J05_09365 [Paludibacter sp.]|nr:hypothetical protein [Paludibacter sp.]
METLKKNRRTLSPLQMNNCRGGKRYEMVSYVDSEGKLRVRIIVVD